MQLSGLLLAYCAPGPGFTKTSKESNICSSLCFFHCRSLLCCWIVILTIFIEISYLQQFSALFCFALFRFLFLMCFPATFCPLVFLLSRMLILLVSFISNELFFLSRFFVLTFCIFALIGLCVCAAKTSTLTGLWIASYFPDLEIRNYFTTLFLP